MYAIKNATTGLFVKRVTCNDEEMGRTLQSAMLYKTFSHANEVVFWNLDHSQKWVIVNVETGEEFEKETAKYHP